MTQVSKNPLSPKIKRDIEEAFWWILANLQKEEEVKNFLNDFLSPTERVMLVKRLAIAVLLLRGYTYKNIREVLKVSYPTINHIQRWLSGGGRPGLPAGRGYRMVFEKLNNKERFEEFYASVDNFLKDIFGVHFTADRETERAVEEGFKNILSDKT